MIKSLTVVFIIFLLCWRSSFSAVLINQIDLNDSTNTKVDTCNQQTEHEEKITWHQMVTDIPSDYISFFKKTANVNMIPTYIGIAALTGSLMFADQGGWTTQRKLFLKSSFDHRASNFIVNFGNGSYQFLSAAVFATAGLVLHDKTALRTGSNIAEAVLATGIFVQVLKRITGRESPIASSEKGGDWAFMPSIKEYQKNQPRYYSFPSGHLATATAVLTVIANNYPDQKWIRPIGYPLLGLLGFSLVNKGMHWYSDLPLAYFLGYTFGNIIAPPKIEKNSKNKASHTNIAVFPSLGNDNMHLNLLITF